MKGFVETIVSILQLIVLAIGVGAVLGLTLATAYGVFIWWVR